MICGANVEVEKHAEGIKSYIRHLFSYRNTFKQRSTFQMSNDYFSFLTSSTHSASFDFSGYRTDDIPIGIGFGSDAYRIFFYAYRIFFDAYRI